MRCAECGAGTADAQFCVRCGAAAAQRPSLAVGGPGDFRAWDLAGSASFSTTRLRPGYDEEEVDAFLGAIRATFLGTLEPPLTADEIRNKQFSTTRLRPGYDEEEVDAFLDEVETKLRRRCAECGAPAAKGAQFCARCGAPSSWRSAAEAVPPAGGASGSRTAAAAKDGVSRPARARLVSFLAFLACCLITPISVLVAINAPNNSALAGVAGVVAGTALVLAPISLIAFVQTLSQHRRSRVRQVAWSLVPIVSFAVLAWWPFLVRALIRLRARDWAVFAAYLTAMAAAIVVVIPSPRGIIPTSAGIMIFFTTVLLVGVTAAVHTLVAFRPAAELPTLPDAQRARAAAKRHPPVLDAGRPPGWQQTRA